MLDKSKIPNNGINIHGSKTLTGVYYAKEANLSSINGSKAFNYGADSERLSNATDSRIKRRIYLTLKTGEQIPEADFGSGEYAYIADISGIFDYEKASEDQRDAVRELMSDDSPNEFESSVLDAGYYGYLKDNIIVCLDMNIKVKGLGKNIAYENNDGAPPELDTKKQKLPHAVKTKKLTKKDSNKISAVMSALKSKAPSANISNSNLNVDEHEYPNFIREAATFPDMPNFVHSEHKRLNLDKDAATLSKKSDAVVDEVDDDSKRRSRARDNRDSEKSILQDIRSILISGKLSDTFAAKISDVLKNFIRESNTFQESRLVDDQGMTDEDTKARKEEAKSDDKISTLLEEIEAILRTIQKGTEKDKETGRERLLEIMESSSSLPHEEQEFLHKRMDEILTAMRTGETNPEPSPKAKTPFSVPEAQDVDTKEKSTPTPVAPEVKVPAKEKSNLMHVAKNLLDEILKPKEQKRQEITPVKEEKEKEHKKREATTEHTQTHPSGNTVTTPAYTPEVSHPTMTDVIVANIVNKKKDIVERDAEGNEVSRKMGDNKQHYRTALHHKGDEYLGTGNTELLLKKASQLKEKIKNASIYKNYKKDEQSITPVAPVAPVAPEITSIDRSATTAKGRELQKGDWQKSPTDGISPAASSTEESGSLLGDIGDAAATASVGKGLLGKGLGFAKKAMPYAAAGAVMYGGSQLLDSGLSAVGVGGKEIDESADDANWNRMSKWEKVQSGVGRGIEKVGSFVGQDSLVNEAKAGRIKHETEWLDRPENKTVQSVSGKIKPALGEVELKPETKEIEAAGIDKETANNKQENVAPTIINNNNTTTNSSPTSQVLSNTMMTQRNSESAYRNMVNKRFS